MVRKKVKMDRDVPGFEDKNEIDHLVINDSRIIQNIVCRCNFNFFSDRRIVQGASKIMDRIRYKNYKRNTAKCKLRNMIPEYSKKKANEFARKELKNIKIEENKLYVRSHCNQIEQIITTLEKFGKEETNIKTDDKIIENTKNIIQEKKKLILKSNKTKREKIKLCELHKMIRRKIRKNNLIN